MCKNGWTDQFAVQVVDLDGLKEAQAELYSPGGANVPHDTLLWAVQKQLNQSICCLGCGLGCAQGSASSIEFAKSSTNVHKINCIRQVALEPAPPGEYHWTVHLWWRCGLMSSYFDHLLLLLLWRRPEWQRQQLWHERVGKTHGIETLNVSWGALIQQGSVAQIRHVQRHSFILLIIITVITVN